MIFCTDTHHTMTMCCLGVMEELIFQAQSRRKKGQVESLELKHKDPFLF